MVVLRCINIAILATLGLIVVVHSHSDDKRLLLDNEPTVDLSGEVSRLQAQLLDQQKLVNAIQKLTATLQKDLENTTAALKHQEVTAAQKDQELQRNITDLKLENEQLNTLQKDILKNTTDQLKQQEAIFQNNITELNGQLMAIQKGSGSVYVRWGRKVCPSTAGVVYTGFMAGKHCTNAGSGSDNLCLPDDPSWSKFVDGASNPRGYIYGTEIDTTDSDHIFTYPVNHQDMPCVVCRSTKTSTVMIPARNNCYDGWTMEYNGYLMAAYYGHYTFNHACVDGNPEFLNHGSTTDSQHILYLVEGKCGSLQCPPYVEGRELACVVCSK